MPGRLRQRPAVDRPAVKRPRLAERALEYLVDVSVGERFQSRRPLAVDAASLGGGAHPSVPADLLHVIIELDAVAVRVERKGRIVDAGVELGRDRVDESDPMLLQQGNRLAQLRIAAHLHPEPQASRVLTATQYVPQFLRVQRDTMGFGATTQKTSPG